MTPENPFEDKMMKAMEIILVVVLLFWFILNVL